MKNTLWHVKSELPGMVRQEILSVYKPRFANIHCNGITYAYKVTPDFIFPEGLLDVEVIAHHINMGNHEALVVKVGPLGLTKRPDGKLFHITLSTADGVPPAQAGEINPKRLNGPAGWAPPIQFQTSFRRLMLRPGRVDRLAA